MDTLFETVVKATEAANKNYEENLKISEAQELADCFFNSSLVLAIASLKNGLRIAENTRNIRLIKIIEKDLNTFRKMLREKNG